MFFAKFWVFLFILFSFSYTSTFSAEAEVEKDFDAINSYFKKSCELGIIDGCVNFWKRIKNQDRMLKTYKRRCGKSNEVACFELAIVLEENGEVAEALKKYIFSCKRGKLKRACLRVGELMVSEEKHSKALPYLEKSCDANLANGCFLLAKSKNILITKSLKKECDGGNAKSCNRLARSSKKKMSKESLLKACQGGMALSCYNLAKIEDTNFDVHAARVHYKMACDGNHYLACSNLGYIENMAGNNVVAKKYYKKACFGGEKSGCKRMKHLTD